MKPLIVKPYKGESLTGKWQISYKLDGVQIIYENGLARTRGGKLLESFPKMPDGTYELFDESWSRSMTYLNKETRPPSKKLFYRLDVIDRRLNFGQCGPDGPSSFFDWAEEFGAGFWESILDIEGKDFEGIVFTNGKIHYKLKHTETIDLPILKITEGTGRQKGMAGVLHTSMGKVSVGLTTIQRIMLWKNKSQYIGSIIECKYKNISEAGQMIEPRFFRFRPDKSSVDNQQIIP